MEKLCDRLLKQGVLSLVIVSLSVCSTSLVSVAGQVASLDTEEEAGVLLDDQKKEPVAEMTETSATDAASLEEPPFEVSEPTVTVDDGEGIDGMTMLYAGGAIGLAAIAVAALAGGGSSGSGSSSPSTPSTPVVGPDLNGSNWLGFLDIKDTRSAGYQNISATIVQNGSAVQINTSSTLDYGHQFNGSIDSSGNMLMYDSITGEDWTTHYSKATANSVDLYDYVNNLKELDRMLLNR